MMHFNVLAYNFKRSIFPCKVNDLHRHMRAGTGCAQDTILYYLFIWNTFHKNAQDTQPKAKFELSYGKVIDFIHSALDSKKKPCTLCTAV